MTKTCLCNLLIFYYNTLLLMITSVYYVAISSSASKTMFNISLIISSAIVFGVVMAGCSSGFAPLSFLLFRPGLRSASIGDSGSLSAAPSDPSSLLSSNIGY